MRFFLTALSALVLFAYPFAVYFGINKYGLNIISGVLIAALIGRLVFAQRSKLVELKYLAMTSAIVGLALVGIGTIFKQQGWLLYYPVVVNLSMLAVFGASLFQKQTVIERLARLQEPDLPQSGIQYTRKVTQVWCGFFISNASIALYTCFISLEAWTIYNGLISYLLAGVLFLSEWIVRQRARKHQETEKENAQR